jgi:hypothetical protein
MSLALIEFLRLSTAAAIGLAIGLGFGVIQRRALLRHAKLQEAGHFQSGWAATPGSFRRVAYLLVALALVQLVCPLLFAPGSLAPWYVSGGLVIGYGWMLYLQLRRRLP